MRGHHRSAGTDGQRMLMGTVGLTWSRELGKPPPRTYRTPPISHLGPPHGGPKGLEGVSPTWLCCVKLTHGSLFRAGRAWTAAAPMRTARYGHSLSMLIDGRVLVCGGGGGDNNTTDAEIFDPETNAWTAATPMRTARCDHSQLTLGDGRVLVCGGSCNREATSMWRSSTPRRTRGRRPRRCGRHCITTRSRRWPPAGCWCAAGRTYARTHAHTQTTHTNTRCCRHLRRHPPAFLTHSCTHLLST